MEKGSLGKYVLIWFWCLLMGLILMGCLKGCMELAKVVPDDDGEYEQEVKEECIKLRIEKGYPEDYAKRYCTEISRYCRFKVYEENCNPEVKCCFVTIEEDKKWNYLDYDKNGNKNPEVK